MSLEELVQGWLEEVVAGEPEGKPLHQVQVVDTAFGNVTSKNAVMIGPASSRFAPARGGGQAAEYGGSVLLIILALVEGREPAKFKEARERAGAIAARLAYLSMVESSDLGGRVRDSLPGEYTRTFTPETGQKYAVGNLPLHVNVAGQAIGG